MRGLEIRVEHDPEHAIADHIEAKLIEALRQNVPPSDGETLTILARDGANVIAGLVGGTSYGWLLVKILWVAEEFRGQGLGACVMAKAEELARHRGCHGAWLDTSSARAEQFYVRLGYEQFGVLQNEPGEHPHGHRRAFLAKRLT